MMRSRCFVIVLLLCAVVWIAGCKVEPEHVQMYAKGPSFESLEQMEDACDVIVEGIRLETEEPVITRSDGNVVSAYTFSQLQITKIHKDPGGELTVGSVITILENEAYDEAENAVYHVGGYHMMVPQCEYLLFLTDRTTVNSANPYYVATGVNYGTVSLDDDGRGISKTARDNSMVSQYDKYQPLWQAAKEKYCTE